MKFLPSTTTTTFTAVTALVLATSSVVVVFVEAGVCSSVSGICSTDNNGMSQNLNGKTYCVDDGCTINLGESVTTEICGVSISGIAPCPEPSAATSIFSTIDYYSASFMAMGVSLIVAAAVGGN